VHDIDSTLEYARRLKALQKEISPLLIMRVYFEKPRTRHGWKGLLYDPHFTGQSDLALGLRTVRYLLEEIAALDVPIATEFLDPLVAPYFADLITWGTIGARTTASQPHRQLASHLPFPVGFKNPLDGHLETAIDSLHAAAASHTFFALSDQARLIQQTSSGNPNTHLILRGTHSSPNADPETINRAYHLFPRRILIDCAHGNSKKNPQLAKLLLQRLICQPHLLGFMLESHLQAGRQSSPSLYGVSLTDPCLSFQETAELLLNLDPFRPKLMLPNL
jgi:3-deoxy-7-phosphoheptulonate synthase